MKKQPIEESHVNTQNVIKQLGNRILRRHENPAAQNASLHKTKQEMG